MTAKSSTEESVKGKEWRGNGIVRVSGWVREGREAGRRHPTGCST